MVIRKKKITCIFNRKIIVDFLDLSLLKDPIYVNIVLGITFALYSDMAFFTIQPMYMFELNFEKVNAFYVFIFVNEIMRFRHHEVF